MEAVAASGSTIRSTGKGFRTATRRRPNNTTGQHRMMLSSPVNNLEARRRPVEKILTAGAQTSTGAAIAVTGQTRDRTQSRDTRDRTSPATRDRAQSRDTAQNRATSPSRDAGKSRDTAQSRDLNRSGKPQQCLQRHK
jgi:hypothetical protein